MEENKDAMVDTNSTCIMLIPDQAYKQRRPTVEEAHLTVAYFGRFAQDAPEVASLKRAVHGIAKSIGGPIEVKANAVGLFPEGESFALVDLIDGIGTFYARRDVENLFGPHGAAPGHPTIDYTHGFTPHVTRKYLAPEDIDQDTLFWEILPDESFDFTFDAIGVWHGKNHYEVAL